LNPTFKIHSTETATGNTELVLLVSLDSISFIISDAANKCIALYSYQLTPDAGFDYTASQIKKVVLSQDLLNNGFEKITIVYAFPTAIIVPEQFSSDQAKKEMLDLVFGDQNDALVRTDIDTVQNRHIVYTVPNQVASVIDYLFSSHKAKHLYSLLTVINGLNGNDIYCIFWNNYFTAMLVKAGKLQAIQTYQYKSPDDVAYYLLHLCESFEVAVNDTTLHLNGMVGENSNLYNELSKYFLHLQFESLPPVFTYPEAMKEYPAHYFSHLFALASCV
jgi:hypothetical protein